jgi:putative inorganic carbon (HCO3(-)) transporter
VTGVGGATKPSRPVTSTVSSSATGGDRNRILRIAWICSIGVVFTIQDPVLGKFRLSPADLLVMFFIFMMLWRGRPSAIGHVLRESVPRWLIGFSAVAVLIGTATAWSRLGYVPQWTWINRDVGTVFLLASCFLIASGPARPAAIAEALKWFLLSGSLVNAVALVGMGVRLYGDLPNRLIEGLSSLRLAGTMGNPNMFGGYLALVLIVQLCALMADRHTLKWPPIAQIINAALLTVGLLLTISRGAWLAAFGGTGIVLGIAAIYARRGQVAWPRFAAAASIGAILAVVTIMSLSGSLRAISEATVNPVSPLQDRTPVYDPQGGSFAEEFIRIARDRFGGVDRVAIARVALAKLSSPADVMFGIGTGVFLEESPDTPLRYRVLIHNVYVWVLVELGLIGLILFGGLLISMFVTVARALRSSQTLDVVPLALLGALTTLAVYFLSQDGLYRRYTWLVIGLVILFARSLRAGQTPTPTPVVD